MNCLLMLRKHAILSFRLCTWWYLHFCTLVQLCWGLYHKLSPPSVSPQEKLALFNWLFLVGVVMVELIESHMKHQVHRQYLDIINSVKANYIRYDLNFYVSFKVFLLNHSSLNRSFKVYLTRASNPNKCSDDRGSIVN